MNGNSPSSSKTQRAANGTMQRLVQRALQLDTVAVEPQADGDIKQIGKYPVTAFLGRGGMGDVYAGRHTELDLPVAIKVIHARYVADPRYRERFLTEARLASRINDPHVVRVHDAGEADGQYFMVMEYVGGGDVSARIHASQDGCLPVDEALRLVTEVAQGLAAAEKAQIVHRDIKPGNILLTRDGQAKLADLGLARQVDAPQSTPADVRLTQPGSTLGSPAYMAPELVGDSRCADSRSDIYALGITFYEMVTGELPFAANSNVAVLYKQMHEPIQDPRLVNAAIPAGVARVIRKMTAKRPQDRYQNTAALLADLHRLVQPSWRRASPLLAAAAGLLILAAASLVLARRPAQMGHDLATAIEALARGDYAAAAPLLEADIATTRKDSRLLYALGLCYVKRGQPSELADVRHRLQELPDGAELGKHLELLQLIEAEQYDQALDVAEECERTARYRLLFSYSRGIVHLKRQDMAQAEACLSSAVEQAALFDFQRFAVVDALARLFVARGKPDRASAMYASALKGKTGGEGIGPAAYTNYAVALMNAGKPGEAAEPLRLALELDPKNEMALYLQEKTRQESVRSASDALQRTMAMLDEVGAMLKDPKRPAQDPWTGSPVILVFLPSLGEIDPGRRLGEVQFWLDGVAEAVAALNRFPVVDREALDQILREQKLSASELGAPDASVKLGRLFPASVLIKSRFAASGKGLSLQLQLVDVATSEIVGILRRELPDQPSREAVAGEVAGTLVQLLLKHFPIQGKVTGVEGQTGEINLGRCHGLTEGQVLGLYPAQASATAEALSRQSPAARLTVASVARFTASGRIEAATVPVVPGMLVVAVGSADPPPGGERK